MFSCIRFIADEGLYVHFISTLAAALSTEFIQLSVCIKIKLLLNFGFSAVSYIDRNVLIIRKFSSLNMLILFIVSWVLRQIKLANDVALTNLGQYRFSYDDKGTAESCIHYKRT